MSHMVTCQSLSNLLSIYTPKAILKLGKNTNSLFSQLPISTEKLLDIKEMRSSVSEWDSISSFKYPEGTSPTQFKDITIEKIPVSLRRIDSNDPNIPTVILIHGGGFFCELTNVHKSLMANIASRIDCHGVLPHYSLSPENKAPFAIDEITEILKTLLTHPEKYGLTKNLVVIGYSSGGNLAWNAISNLLDSAATKNLVRQYITHFILMSPFLDLSLKTVSFSPYQAQQNADKMLQPWALKQMSNWFLSKDASQETIDRYSPVYLSGLDRMPNTTLIVGEFDALLADSIYAFQILHNAGVQSKLIILEGQTHNHSAHINLRDGVFTPDIIASIIKKEPVVKFNFCFKILTL